MNSWIKILSLLPILALEGIVIYLDIPDLNLIAGGLLLITILIAYTFIAELWDKEKEIRTTKKKAGPVEYPESVPGGFAAADRRAAVEKPMPESGKKRRFSLFSARKNVSDAGMPVPEPWEKRRFSFFSARKNVSDAGMPVPESGEKRRFSFFSARKNVSDAGMPVPEPGEKRRFSLFSARKNVSDAGMPVPEPGNASRFPTFSAMVQGLKSLRQGLSSSLGKKKRTGGDISGDSTLKEASDKAGISLASVRADATSPVLVKQEPSPFSPLIKGSGLDADLIHPPRGMGVSADQDDIRFDENFADIEIPVPESSGRADLTHEDEISLTFDEDNDEVSPAFPESFPDQAGSPGEEEVSLDEELESLDHLDLDTVGLEPGTVTPDSGPATAEKEQVLAKKMIDSDVREEYMSPFSSESGGDTDLLSSLKSEMQGSQKRANSSLIRDMKDIKVHVHDIEEELISFLQAK